MGADTFSFSNIFKENSDGSLTPLRSISVNGVTFGSDVNFNHGVTFAGVDFHQYKNFNILGEEQGDVLVIKGFIPK